MHKKGYCHRDLKPWNIMLNDDFTAVKVIDFSYSTSLNQKILQKSPANPILEGWLSGTA
jgi:serine/threonine protein kinase